MYVFTLIVIAVKISPSHLSILKQNQNQKKYFYSQNKQTDASVFPTDGLKSLLIYSTNKFINIH